MSEPVVKKTASVFVALSTMALLSGAIGCGMGPAAPGGPVAQSGITISGIVHGGEQPISGAVIQLYSAGNTGYGTGATALLHSSVTTGSDGSFSITTDYNCASVTTPVYLTATGGNPGLTAGTDNTAIELAAPLGTCGNLTAGTNIVVNEVTTVATAFALGQYFTTTFGAASTDGFGAPNTTQAQLGLTNAFATVNNLVDTTNGYAVTSATLTGAGGTVTTTPEASKIDTIADILASCVDTTGGASGDGSNCGILFNDVTPTGGTPPTDILQAAVDMSLNPASNNANTSAVNLAALYALVGATPPFPAQATQPTDWTVGIQYTDPNATLLLRALGIAIDAGGDVWVLDSGSKVTGNLVELSPTGTPLVSALGSATAGAGINAATPKNVAIDTAGNVWITTSSGSSYVFEYVPASGTSANFAAGKAAWGLAIDGSNDVFVGDTSGSANYELQEIPGGNINDVIEYPIASSTPGTAGSAGDNPFVTPEYMAFDTTGNLWMTNATDTSETSANELVQLSNINDSACIGGAVTYPCSLTTSTTANTFTAFAQGSPSEPYGVAANVGSMWFANANSGTNTISYISLDGSTGATYGDSTSLSTPEYIATDGSGNLWVGDYAGQSVSEFSSTGVALSANSVPGYKHTGMSDVSGVAIDPSGNVWAASYEASGSKNGNSIFEIVGAASPAITPIAQALASTKVGAKP